MTSGYGGILRASLTNPSLEEPIDTFAKVVESGLTWDLILYGEEIENYMATTNDPVIRTIWDNKQVVEYDPENLERVRVSYGLFTLNENSRALLG